MNAQIILLRGLTPTGRNKVSIAHSCAPCMVDTRTTEGIDPVLEREPEIKLLVPQWTKAT